MATKNTNKANKIWAAILVTLTLTIASALASGQSTELLEGGYRARRPVSTTEIF